MQLTIHTDYALRTLIALGLKSPAKMTAAEIGAAYDISLNHLLKVIQQLSDFGYVETVRGRGGGVRLGRAAEDIVVGQVVRDLERDLGVVACLRDGAQPCVISGQCRLRTALSDATDAFLAVLDGVTLADVLKPRSKLVQLLGVRPPPAATIAAAQAAPRIDTLQVSDLLVTS